MIRIRDDEYNGGRQIPLAGGSGVLRGTPEIRLGYTYTNAGFDIFFFCVLLIL